MAESETFSFFIESQQAERSLASLAKNFLGLNLALGVVTKGVDALAAAFEGGVKLALDFELQVARLQTISQDAASSTAKWATNLRALSTQFNVPLLQVTEAAYRGIASQSLKTSDDLRILAEALKLSRVTGADAKDSMLAMNAVLTNYGLSAGQAELASNALFQAVKRGGLTVEELGQGFGRVASIAAPLGVSLDSLVAILAVLRSKGIPAQQAIAGLSQVMIELERPSKTMREAMDKIGVASGQQAVAAYGLVGALQRLNAEIEKQGGEEADVLKNQRALRVDLALTADAAKQYEQNMKGGAKSTEELGKALETVADAPGQKFQAWVNKQKNSFETLGVLVNAVKDSFAQHMEQGEQHVGVGDNMQEDLDPAFKNMTPEKAQANVAKLEAIKAAKAAELEARQSAFQKELQLITEHRAAMNAANKLDLDAIRKNSEGFLDALNKRIEGFKDTSFKMREGFANSLLERALQHASPDQAKSLIETRVDSLQQQESTKFADLDKLRGKDLLESRGPEELKRIAQEILDLRTKQAEKAIETAKTDSDRLAAEEQLRQAQQESLDVEQHIQEIFERRLKAAKEIAEQDRKFSQGVKNAQATEKQAVDLSGTGADPAAINAMFAAAMAQLKSLDVVLQTAVKSNQLVGFGPNGLNPTGPNAAEHIKLIGEAAEMGANYISGLNAAVQNLTVTLSGLDKQEGGRGTTLDFGNPWAPWDMMKKVRGYADGGRVASSDTVPAMLTPGEFVVNAQASRSFLPLLEAINRKNVRGFADGGSVTNVGDINVTVKGGSTSQETVEEVARGIRRGIRRGTIRLN